MNKKSQALFAGIGIAVMVFVFVLAIIPVLSANINTFRADMQCSASNLTAGDWAICTVVDFWTFYFGITAIGAGLVFLTGKALLNRG